MPWIVKTDKEFEWVGKWATAAGRRARPHVDARRLREPDRRDPGRGRPGRRRRQSRPGASRASAGALELGKVIGLAIVPNELAVDGGRFDVQVDGRAVPMTVHLGAVLRSRRARGEVVSVLDFLSVDAAADHGGFHPVASSAIERAQRDARRDVRGARRLARPRLDSRRGGARAPSGSPTSRT